MIDIFNGEIFIIFSWKIHCKQSKTDHYSKNSDAVKVVRCSQWIERLIGEWAMTEDGNIYMYEQMWRETVYSGTLIYLLTLDLKSLCSYVFRKHSWA